MATDNFNEEKIIKLLKGLPRCSAPEDFEINLKHRINMLDADKIQKKQQKYSLRNILLPVTSLAVATFAAVMVFFNGENTTNISQTDKPRVGNEVVKISDKLPVSDAKKLSIKASIDKEIAERSAPVAGPEKRQSSVRERVTSLPLPGPENKVDISLRARPHPGYNASSDRGSNMVNFNQSSGFSVEDSNYEVQKKSIK